MAVLTERNIEQTTARRAPRTRVYTTDEAAKLLHLRTDTVRRMLQSGKLKGVKVGHQWRVLASAISTQSTRKATAGSVLVGSGSKKTRSVLPIATKPRSVKAVMEEAGVAMEEAVGRFIEVIGNKAAVEKVVNRAIEVIGTKAAALCWMGTPVRGLGDSTPISLLGSEAGRNKVLNLLGQAEDGVW